MIQAQDDLNKDFELDSEIEVIDLKNEDLIESFPDDVKKMIKEKTLVKNENGEIQTEEKEEPQNLSEMLEEKIEKTLKAEYKIDRNLESQTSDRSEVHLPDGRIVHIRKWKIKDKKNFDAAKNWSDAKDALVYNCLEEDIAIDQEEFNYLLFRIRDLSVHDKLKFTVYCPNCSAKEKLELDLSKLVHTKGGNYKDIVSGNNTFKIGAITKKDLYEALNNSELSEFSLFINDFVFHIKEYNNIVVETAKDYADLADFIANLDADEANEIFKQWMEMRFTVVFDNKIKCKDCGEEFFENFSTLPEFFPESWRVLDN